MIKYICLITRRSDLSHEQFKAYYEDNHVPLICSINKWMNGYKRSYVCEPTVMTGGIRVPHNAPWTGKFDVITEISFADESAHKLAMAALMDPENGKLIDADERKFLDQDKKVMFMIDERQTEF